MQARSPLTEIDPEFFLVMSFKLWISVQKIESWRTRTTGALSDMISYENKHTAFLVFHKHESH